MGKQVCGYVNSAKSQRRLQNCKNLGEMRGIMIIGPKHTEKTSGNYEGAQRGCTEEEKGLNRR